MNPYNPYEGPILKIVGKIFLTSILYGIAFGLSRIIWR